MTDEFKNTETAATSTTEFPNPRDPLCLVVLIFAASVFLPLQEMRDYELCVLNRMSV